MVVNNLMHAPIDQMVSNQKSLAFQISDLSRIIVGAQLVTLSFSPKFGITNGHKTKLLLARSSGYPG